MHLLPKFSSRAQKLCPPRCDYSAQTKTETASLRSCGKEYQSTCFALCFFFRAISISYVSARTQLQHTPQMSADLNDYDQEVNTRQILQAVFSEEATRSDNLSAPAQTILLFQAQADTVQAEPEIKEL